MKKEFTTINGSWEDINYSEFPDIPTMISIQEQRYLYWLANYFFQGKGEIVEVGTWLGGSTASLASGLRDARVSSTLHCYDNFVWIKSYESKSAGIRLPDGADFHPHFKKLIDTKFNNVKSTKAQLSEITWTGEPIEVLFLDAPKNKEDMIQAIQKFFPYLIPGFSLVVFQDFLYSPAYAVPASICAINDHLSLVHTVSKASTVAFKVNKVQSEYNRKDIDYDCLSLDDLNKRFEDMIGKLPAQPSDYLVVSQAMMIFDKGILEDATNIINGHDFSSDGFSRLKFLASMPYLQRKYGELFRSIRCL